MPAIQFVDQIDHMGFAIVAGILDSRSVIELQRAVTPLLDGAPAAGIRNLADKVPAIRALARSAAIRALVEPVLGFEARLVRSVLFNKSEEANWQVAWHQDLSIAVQAKCDVEGFTSWSMKEGVPHVQPPISILRHMLTVRVHLDAADESNGALCVSPGTHALEKLPASDAGMVARRYGEHLCAVDAGDVLLIRPLTLHCSRKATNCRRPRRVVHLEFSGVELPAPLRWAEGDDASAADSHIDAAARTSHGQDTIAPSQPR